MTLRRTLDYVRVLPFSFLGAAIVWTFTAPERLYHCYDEVPIIAFTPPFVHPWADIFDGAGKVDLLGHDYYIWPVWAVYSVWLCFVVIALFVPYFLTRTPEKDEPIPTV